VNSVPEDFDDDISGQNELEAAREVDQEVAARLAALELLGVTFRAGTTEIESVPPHSAAERAGLRAGDSVVCVNGWPALRAADVVAAVRRLADPTAHLTVQRDGTVLGIDADLDSSQERPTARPGNHHSGDFMAWETYHDLGVQPFRRLKAIGFAPYRGD